MQEKADLFLFPIQPRVTAGELFGTREYLKNNYLYRMSAATAFYLEWVGVMNALLNRKLQLHPGLPFKTELLAQADE